MPSKNPEQRKAVNRKWWKKARLNRIKNPDGFVGLSARDHARWNRAIHRLMKDVAAQVRTLTPEEIAKLYPDGYDTGKIPKDASVKRRGRKAKIHYGF